MVETLPRAERHALGAFVRRFPQVHLGIGLFGNALFLTGSILFVSGRQSVGTVFFLLGSIGMFLGSLGQLLRALSRRRLARYDVDPARPDQRWSEAG